MRLECKRRSLTIFSELQKKSEAGQEVGAGQNIHSRESEEFLAKVFEGVADVIHFLIDYQETIVCLLVGV